MSVISDRSVARYKSIVLKVWRRIVRTLRLEYPRRGKDRNAAVVMVVKTRLLHLVTFFPFT